MTNQNEPKNLTGEEADDLIAELARIVADDAQQSNMAQSIDARAETNLHIPSVDPALESNTSHQAPAPVPQPEPEEPAVLPVPPQPVELPEVPDEEEQLFESPFEFDFSENIQSDIADSEGFESKNVAPEIELGTDMAETNGDQLDAIAAIIEDTQATASSADEAVAAIDVASSVEQTATDIVNLDEEPPLEAEQSASAFAQPEWDVVSTEPQDDPEPYDESEAESDDNFSVPPSMTNDMTGDSFDADSQAEVEDALAEIESLIAETRSAEPETTAQKAPADAAQAAIFAALGAAGTASVSQNANAQPADRIDPVLPPQGTATNVNSLEGAKAEKAPSSSAQRAEKQRDRSVMPIIVSVVAVILLAILGGGAYWLFTSQQNEGEVPLIAAQNTEVKQTPEPSTEDETNNSSVFNSLEGNSENPSDEQIVPRDETVTAVPTTTPRIITPSTTGEGLTNRKVKTVTVLADGTIVSGEQSAAGAQQLPQDVRPDVPTVASDVASTTSDEITNVLNQIVEQTTPAGDETQSAAQQATVDESQTATEQAPVDDPTAPVPLPRPEGIENSFARAAAAASATQSADSQPVALLPSANNSAANTATSTGVAAPFYVQLSSQRSQEAAEATANSLTRQFSALLSGRTLDIARVDLGERGIFYRVRVPATSLDEANTLCTNIKSSGGDCFVRNN